MDRPHAPVQAADARPTPPSRAHRRRQGARVAMALTIALISGAVVVGAGCGGDDPVAIYTAATREIQAHPGEQFQITLDAVGEDGGYKWHMKRVGDEVTPIKGELIYDPVLNADGTTVEGLYGGGPRHNVWTFKAAHIGRGTVTFRQYQPFTGPSKSDTTVTFRVTVAD